MRLACIPAYNEESRIASVIRAAKDFVDLVVVCDDGSTDDTKKAAEAAGALVISHDRNRGYGAAITSLFDYARASNAESIVTIDGDGQHDANQIPKLLSVLVQHSVDVVIGSRLLDDSRSVPKYRRHGIKIITSVANYGTDLKITDSQSGFRAYSKNAINAIHPTEEGMSVSTEILLKCSNKGLSLAEVPISVSYDRDTSKHNPASHGISVLANTIKYTSIRHPLPFYGMTGTAFLVAGIVMGVIFFDAYITDSTIFYGSLFASVILFLLGAILVVTSIILFSMANLIRDRS